MQAVWGFINEAFMIISAVCVAIGWYFIRQKRVRTHRAFMLAGTVFGAAFFVSYLLATFFVGDTFFGGPAKYGVAYQIFLQVHVLLATLAAVLGVITLRRAFKGRFRKHRQVAPWTASMWFISAITGLGVYLMLFVIFPPGPSTTSLIKILFH